LTVLCYRNTKKNTKREDSRLIIGAITFEVNQPKIMVPHATLQTVRQTDSEMRN